MDSLGQVLHVVGNKVSQLAVLAVVPDLPVRIQFRWIGREPLDIDVAAKSGLQFPDPAAMDHPSVDDKNDARREMFQQISDERFKIVGTNIVVFNRKIQSRVMSFRRAGQCRNDRQAVPAIPTAQNWRLTFRCPGTPDCRLEHKPAFVLKNDGFTRSAGFFLSDANRSVATGRQPLDSAHGPCFRASGNSSPFAGEYARHWTDRRRSRSVYQSPRQSVEGSTGRSDSRVYEALSKASFAAGLSACRTIRACVPADCGLQRRPPQAFDRLFSSRRGSPHWHRQAGQPRCFGGLVPATQWLSAGVAPTVVGFLTVSCPYYRTFSFVMFNFSKSNK